MNNIGYCLYRFIYCVVAFKIIKITNIVRQSIIMLIKWIKYMLHIIFIKSHETVTKLENITYYFIWQIQLKKR